MNTRVLKSVSRVIALACVALMPVALAAQDSTKPAAKAPAGYSPSKWDIFAGYSYLAPKGTVNTPMPDGSTLSVPYHAILDGVVISAARYFNNYVGVEGVGDGHYTDDERNPPSDDFWGGSLGLILRYPSETVTPFAHALVGAEDIGGPHWQQNTWGVGLTAGGGADYNTPLFDHHLAIRLFQVDYQYAHVNYGTVTNPPVWGGRGSPNVVRLSAGVVYHIGSIAPPPPVTLACSASPASVFPGDPVTVTATAGDLNPKLNAVYSFEGSGVTANGATASVATGALAPGTYTVKCGVKEGKPGKEGLKPWEVAEATASYTVKAFEPPTISCSASPTTLKPGDTSTITAMGMSPQNRPLTYSYSAAAGTISGSGTSAVFSSTGAPTGPVAITCNVSDDKNQSATASTSVTIEAPYVAPAPHTQALCSITFEKDLKRPTRVDNEAKACLDEVALDLQKQPDAKAVVVGSSDAKEKEKAAKEEKAAKHNKHIKVQDFAAERAVNTKAYLVTEKGIDASRITVATSGADGQKVEDYLVPAGASFTGDVAGTTPVDEGMVKVEVRKPLGEKHHAAVKKHAAKAK
jgi:outer membrane protein OmpA-like peptidoglycan-associated protein